MRPKKLPILPPPITPVGGRSHSVIHPKQPETPEQLERKGSVDYYWPRWLASKKFATSPEESRSLTLALEYLNRVGKQDGGLGQRTDKQWIQQSRAQLDSALDHLKVSTSDPIRPSRLLNEADAAANRSTNNEGWVTERDMQMAKTKMANPAEYPHMTARQAAAALHLGRSAIYDHPRLERVGSGGAKVLFTTKSVLEVKNSAPD